MTVEEPQAIPDIISFIAEAKRDQKTFKAAIQQMTVTAHPTLILNIIMHYRALGLSYDHPLSKVIEHPLNPLNIILGIYYDDTHLGITASYPVIKSSNISGKGNPIYRWMMRVRTIALYEITQQMEPEQCWVIFVALLTVAQHSLHLQERAQDPETVEALTKIHKRSKQAPSNKDKKKAAEKVNETNLLGEH